MKDFNIPRIIRRYENPRHERPSRITYRKRGWAVKIDLQYPHFGQLETLVSEKLVTRRRHQRHPISIYNYSQSAQFMPPAQWTDPLMDCRGLVLTDDGQIVAKPFRKFWNIEQIIESIPISEIFTVSEKLDGSLGIAMNYQGELVCATRGSFESDQACWMRKVMDSIYKGFVPPPGSTFLFEVIYRVNRIVVNYGDVEDLFLLGVIDNESGHFRDDLVAEFSE